MLQLKNHDIYIVVQGDKNLGPCILKCRLYIERTFSEHLGNDRNYRRITPLGAFNRQRGLQYRIRVWISKFRPRRQWEPPAEYTCISEAEITYLNRALKYYPDKLARFRQTCKIHKNPWKMRPIIACAGTFMNHWSKWLDFLFQTLKPLIPSYAKDGNQILSKITPLKLPPHALLFVTDANSMYNNIDTDHAIKVITWWLNDLSDNNQLPSNFPLQAVLEAMTIIMQNNIFEFGDCYFLQLLGTAMGTSAAVMWATLYYGYHEVHTIIPKHGNNLLYFKRYIDDIFGIWIGNLASDWHSFANDIDKFGVLTWDIRGIKPSTSANFLDMTLTIENHRIISRTYQKAMNLHLYIPPMSEHPPGSIRGTIFGLISRYYQQNTFLKDFAYFSGLLYQRTLQRGWDRRLIRDLILEATSRIVNKTNSTQEPIEKESSVKDTLFLHFKFHKDGISRQAIRLAFEKHLGKICHDDLNVDKMTVAYSRPLNIGNYVTRTKLHQAPTETASKLFGEFLSGLDPR